MADLNVLMVVDTKNIAQKVVNGEYVGNLDKTVFLMDDNGDPEGSDDFTITCNPDDLVQFRITAVDQTTGIQFAVFSWVESQEVNNFVKLPSLENGWCSETQKGTIETEDFLIYFTIEGKNQIFRLDPQIQIKSGG
ncbi:MAG: hypothetical protein AAFQ94_00485 [Bacteroidota bacterium]